MASKVVQRLQEHVVFDERVFNPPSVFTIGPVAQQSWHEHDVPRPRIVLMTFFAPKPDVKTRRVRWAEAAEAPLDLYVVFNAY